jgi:hypothetical protein
MKKLSILFAILFVPLFLSAQSEAIDKLIKKYSGQEGVTLVNVSPELFQIMSGLEIEEIDDVDFPIDKLTAVKILAVENSELLAGSNFYDDVTAGLNTADYAEVLSVQDGSEDVKMWMKTEGKQIREFLLVVSSPDEGVVVYISGDFNMSDIEGLAESFGGIEGLGELEIN